VLDPDLRVQGEALPVRTQLSGYEGGAGPGIDTETGAGSPGIRAQGDTSLDRGRGDLRQEQIGLVRRLVGRRVDLVGQVPTPPQGTQDTLVQGARESEHVGLTQGRSRVEHGFGRRTLDVIDAVQNQGVEVQVQVQGRAKALDQDRGTSLGGNKPPSLRAFLHPA